MTSPFPGMDPYLENPGDWPDFHQRFINYWCEAIAEQLPERYEARIGERVRLLLPPEGTPKDILPDVTVARRVASEAGPPGSLGGAVTTIEPVRVPLPAIEVAGPPESYIEVLRRPGRWLVTVLELLSPTNKANPDREEYLKKRNALYRRNVHQVELDLLRRGLRLPMGGPLPPGDYYNIVSQSDRWPMSDVYAWGLRHVLPTLPVPLSEPDPDLLVDYGLVFRTTYEKGRYARSLPYDEPPDVPLSDDDRKWVEERVRVWKEAARPA